MTSLNLNNKNQEFRFENHKYRWTAIDTHIVHGTTFVLAESSLGDEAPYIVFMFDNEKIYDKFFEKSGVTLPVVPTELIIDDEVYDDIITALEDNDII